MRDRIEALWLVLFTDYELLLSYDLRTRRCTVILAHTSCRWLRKSTLKTFEESKLEAVKSSETSLEEYGGPQDGYDNQYSSQSSSPATLHRALEWVGPLRVEIQE